MALWQELTITTITTATATLGKCQELETFFALRFSLTHNIGCCWLWAWPKEMAAIIQKRKCFAKIESESQSLPLSTTHFSRPVVSLDGFLICYHRFLIKNCTKEGGKKKEVGVRLLTRRCIS